MPDDPSSVVAASPSEHGSEVLNSQAIESLLADFRTWLHETKEISGAAEAPTLDVTTVVQQFTALRQEVNLQTRASRTQLEQNTQALDLLRQAQEQMRQQQVRWHESNQQDQDEHVRPLLKALIDAHDALALARREVQRSLESIPSTSARAIPPPTPVPEIRLPFWARWGGLASAVQQQVTLWHEKQQGLTSSATDPTIQRHRSVLDALLVGYEMSLQRIERALQNQGLETIPCAGLPFDPETMEVVEIIRTAGCTGTPVVEVVRPGYRWHGRLFRFAQVRVAKS